MIIRRLAFRTCVETACANSMHNMGFKKLIYKINIMQSESHIQRKVEEFKLIIDLPEFNPIFEKLVPEIYRNGCEVLLGKVKPNMHKITGNICSIILNVDETKDKKNIIWNMFHEYGHHQDKHKLSKEDTNDEKRREKTAWKFADEIFIMYPELKKHTIAYRKFRNECLRSYGIDDFQSII